MARRQRSTVLFAAVGSVLALVGCAGGPSRPDAATASESASSSRPIPPPLTLRLPSRGLVVDVGHHRVRLYSATGRPLMHVRASIANGDVSLHPWLVDRFGREVALRGGAVSFGGVHGTAPGPGGRRLHVVAPRDSKGLGHWVMGVPSPSGRWVLAQWSGECEVPTAYLINARTEHITDVGDRVSGLLPESIALGWLSDNRALVHFPRGACGTSVPLPGVYVVSTRGAVGQRVVSTPRAARVYMWNG